MTMKAILIFALVLYFSCCGMVKGLHRKLSMEEDSEIEKQLKLLNKPAVKSIKIQNDYVYDCVDFFKQPAFDHPLLKNHNYHFEMRPSFLNKTRIEKQSKIPKHNFGLPGEDCPIGTVPIRKTTKENLIAAKALTDADITDVDTVHRVGIRTPQFPNRKFHGAGGTFSVYQPSVTPTQYSSAQIIVKNEFDTIQVGWTVNPALYGDNKTRLFTFFHGGGIACYNILCPGFVMLNTQTPLDTLLEPISTLGGPIYEIKLFVQQDPANGNWWLQLGKDATQLGFWPQRIFSDLNVSATYIEWSGEAGGGSQEKPNMGTGNKPINDVKWDAFCRSIRTQDENYKFNDAQFTEKFTYSDDYEISDWGVQGQDGHIIVFGGPH